MSNDQLSKLRMAAICVLGILGVLVVSMRRGGAMPEAAGPVDPAVKADAGETELPAGQIPANGPLAVGYSGIMSGGDGTPVVNSSGGMNWESVEVAIPGPLGSVEYVKGNDARAVAYLASVREKRDEVVVDNGPTGVDDTDIPRFGTPNAAGRRRVKVLKTP